MKRCRPGWYYLLQSRWETSRRRRAPYSFSCSPDATSEFRLHPLYLASPSCLPLPTPHLAPSAQPPHAHRPPLPCTARHALRLLVPSWHTSPGLPRSVAQADPLPPPGLALRCALSARYAASTAHLQQQRQQYHQHHEPRGAVSTHTTKVAFMVTGKWYKWTRARWNSRKGGQGH